MKFMMVVVDRNQPRFAYTIDLDKLRRQELLIAWGSDIECRKIATEFNRLQRAEYSGLGEVVKNIALEHKKIEKQRDLPPTLRDVSLGLNSKIIHDVSNVYRPADRGIWNV